MLPPHAAAVLTSVPALHASLVVVGLLASTRNDADALFVGVAAAFAVGVVAVADPSAKLSAPTTNAAATLKAVAGFSAPTLEAEAALATLVVALMLALLLVATPVVRSRSPFACGVVYALFAGMVLRDASGAASDAPRLALLAGSAVLGAVSKDILKVQVGAAIFALIAAQLAWPNPAALAAATRGAPETVALTAGVVASAIHDVVAHRRVVEVLGVLGLVAGLSMTGLCVAETFLELSEVGVGGNAPARPRRLTPHRSSTLHATWSAGLAGEQFLDSLLVWSTAFSASLAARILAINFHRITWIRAQVLLGSVVGAGVGFAAWARFAHKSEDARVSSPAFAGIVAAALLARVSSMFPDTQLMRHHFTKFHKSHFWFAKPLGGAHSATASSGSSSSSLTGGGKKSAAASASATPSHEDIVAEHHETEALLRGYASAGFVDIAAVATQALEAHAQTSAAVLGDAPGASATSAASKLPAQPSTTTTTTNASALIDAARKEYAKAWAAANASRFADELVLKFGVEVEAVHKQLGVLRDYPMLGTLTKDAQSRLAFLSREYNRSAEYAQRRRAELARFDDAALDALTKAKEAVEEQEDSLPDAREVGERIVDMLETIKRRKKHNLQLVPVMAPPATTLSSATPPLGAATPRPGSDGNALVLGRSVSAATAEGTTPGDDAHTATGVPVAAAQRRRETFHKPAKLMSSFRLRTSRTGGGDKDGKSGATAVSTAGGGGGSEEGADASGVAPSPAPADTIATPVAPSTPATAPREASSAQPSQPSTADKPKRRSLGSLFTRSSPAKGSS